MSTQLIAVYGTLRRGAPANGYMDGCKWEGMDAVPAHLYKLGWYPGIKIKEAGDFSNETTVVDVYRLPSDPEEFKQALKTMDRYEGYHPDHPDQSLFTRKTIQLLNLDEECFIYEYAHDVDADDIIPDGDWLNAI